MKIGKTCTPGEVNAGILKESLDFYHIPYISFFDVQKASAGEISIAVSSLT